MYWSVRRLYLVSRIRFDTSSSHQREKVATSGSDQKNCFDLLGVPIHINTMHIRFSAAYFVVKHVNMARFWDICMVRFKTSTSGTL